MKTAFIIFSLLCAQSIFGQNKTARLENQKAWQQVVQRAKSENKYIFVDCYTTWYGPCQWMDQNVYMNDTVADFLHKAFIVVKVQMDSTNQDNASENNWYTIAHELSEQYQIRSYPTYLFFSPDGKAVHKAVGMTNVQGFLALARAAMDPHQQYYTLLAQYRRDPHYYAYLSNLADAAKGLNEDSLSRMVAVECLRYLEQLPDSDLWTKDNIRFIVNYANVIRHSDKIFLRYFHERPKIDSVIGSTAYTWRLINVVAYNEDVFPKIQAALKDSSEPDWNSMKNTINSKYGRAFVNKNMLRARQEYYRTTEKWDKYAKYFILDMERLNIKHLPPGADNSSAINNSAFQVFKYSKNRKELKKALSWIDKALATDSIPVPENIDTKANLLYKLGRKREGLALEEQSSKLSPDNREIQENYEKMQKGIPTW